MDKSSRIYVAGHRGLVGSALVRCLQARGCTRLVTRTHRELDLERQPDVEAFFQAEKPGYVFLAAARVGGIRANSTYPVDFLLSNLRVQNNVIEASWRHGVKGLIFLGSSCIYPRLAPQPIKEEYILTGPLEPTNEPYAIAKIAGIELCEAFNRQYGTRFLSVMPTNLYGPNDNYDLEDSHVLPALIRKLHLARLASEGDWQSIAENEERHGPIPLDVLANLASIAVHHGHGGPVRSQLTGADALQGVFAALRPAPAVVLWGTGSPRREFLFVDDLAEACVLLMERIDSFFDAHPASEPGFPHLINIGVGEDCTIRELAEMVRKTVGFNGPIEWDQTKPDGTPRKLLDVTRMAQEGWRAKIPLEQGISMAFQDYLSAL